MLLGLLSKYLAQKQQHSTDPCSARQTTSVETFSARYSTALPNPQLRGKHSSKPHHSATKVLETLSFGSSKSKNWKERGREKS